MGSTAMVLCTCMRARPDSLSSPMPDRSQFLSRRRAEKDLSQEQVVTGNVRYMQRMH